MGPLLQMSKISEILDSGEGGQGATQQLSMETPAYCNCTLEMSLLFCEKLSWKQSNDVMERDNGVKDEEKDAVIRGRQMERRDENEPLSKAELKFFLL